MCRLQTITAPRTECRALIPGYWTISQGPCVWGLEEQEFIILKYFILPTNKALYVFFVLASSFWSPLSEFCTIVILFNLLREKEWLIVSFWKAKYVLACSLQQHPYWERYCVHLPPLHTFSPPFPPELSETKLSWMSQKPLDFNRENKTFLLCAGRVPKTNLVLNSELQATLHAKG